MTVFLALIGFTGLVAVAGFVGAFLRAAVLFWPTMVMLGAVHSYLPFVPALGWTATFFVVALVSLLIPTTTNITNKKD